MPSDDAPAPPTQAAPGLVRGEAADDPAAGGPPVEPDIDAAAVALHRAAVDATPSWVQACVRRIADAQGLDWSPAGDAHVADAAARAQQFVENRLGALLRTDIDQQRSTPLSIFRDAVRFPVEVLHQLGAQPASRADVTRWAFPNDPFGLTPGNLADVAAEVHEAGIVWGATKAGLHLHRRRAEGLR